MKNFSELNQKLSNLLFAKKSRLDCLSMQKSMDKLNLPKVPYIHIAGTNGKGSVAEKMSQVLTSSGYKCGKYTSPHLWTFRERIAIDGQMISESEALKYLPPLLDGFKEHTFFEIMTLLAFTYFADQKVDVAVIEVGLGGQQDATNCICPILSIITSIGFDHQDILGDTLEKIAYEKGGIIKEKTPVLCGPKASQMILKEIAQEKKAPLFQLEGSFASYDEENQAIAQKAFELIHDHFPVTHEALQKGLQAKPPCRLESLTYQGHDVVFDVSHNEPGMRFLYESLKILYPNRDFVTLVSISKSHDAKELAQIIEKESIKVFLLDLIHPRLMKVSALQDYFSSHSAILKADEANEYLKEASKEPVYLFVGSFFMMAEVKEALGQFQTKDHCLIQDGSFNLR